MLKFSSLVFHYHQPPDAYNAKLLFNHVLRRGRELLEKVRNAGRPRVAVPDSTAPPRVVPGVVCSRGAYWQQSATAWRNLVSGYLARNQSGGFASRYAKNFRSDWSFGCWREADGYRGLARKIAMFGFVGVAVGANRESEQFGVRDWANDDICSAIRVRLSCSFHVNLL